MQEEIYTLIHLITQDKDLALSQPMTAAEAALRNKNLEKISEPVRWMNKAQEIVFFSAQ